jgi:hypothetical protein
MAIGDTVQAGLMRIDPSAILRAGEAQARVGETMGQTVSGLVGTYVDTKKRNKELEGERKGITDALRMVGKFRPDMSDDINAQIQFLEDADNPLSQRVAGGIRFLQNIDMAEKLRSTAQAEQFAADKFASEKRLADFKLASDQLGFTKEIFDLMEDKRKRDEDIAMRKLYTPEMEGEQKLAEKQITEAKASQEVQPVFDASGRPMPNLLRIGNQLLQQDDTGRVARLGTAIENVVDVDRTPIATPTIKMVDPERGFRGTIGRQIEDAIQSTARYVGIGTLPDTILEGGKEKLTASQRITTIGRTLEPLLMKTFGGKMTDYQIKRIEQSIPLSSDDPEEGMAKMTETVGLLRDQLNRANDAIGTLNPKTEAFAEAMSTKKGIEANLPIIEEIVNRYYGNIPTSGMGTMGQSPNVDALLESLPKDTNRSRADLDVTDILSQ